MKISIIVVTVAIIFFGGIFFFTKNEKRGTTLDQAPTFILENYKGKKVDLSDSSDKIKVINAWASWCPFCVDELPDFAALQEEFPDDIVVIAVNRRESLDRAREFSDKVGVTERLVLLLDPGDTFYQSIGGFSMPETVFVDSNNDIQLHKRGPMSLDEMREIVNTILNTNES